MVYYHLFVFILLSLGIEKADIIITPKTKWKMYPLFFVMGLIIEAIFLLKFKIWIKLTTLIPLYTVVIFTCLLEIKKTINTIKKFPSYFLKGTFYFKQKLQTKLF